MWRHLAVMFKTNSCWYCCSYKTLIFALLASLFHPWRSWWVCASSLMFMFYIALNSILWTLVCELVFCSLLMKNFWDRQQKQLSIWVRIWHLHVSKSKLSSLLNKCFNHFLIQQSLESRLWILEYCIWWFLSYGCSQRCIGIHTINRNFIGEIVQ